MNTMKLSPVDLGMKRIIEDELKAHRWNKQRTAKGMMISRTTLYNWIAEYGIKKPRNQRNGKRK